ncbi:MAG: hypothetical protein HUK16_00215 [Bacteroidales bacterium]|nr:hypothetical protein [Bacteroidales bacterium]
MIVFVNDIELKTYSGAKVKSAVRAYLNAQGLPLDTERLVVKDAYGNRVDMDGALRAKARLYVEV